MSTIIPLLEKTKVNSIPVTKGQIFQVSTKDSIDDAFSTIVNNNILSAPVWDPTEKKYIGFLDVRDLVAFAVFATKENQQVRSLREIVNHGAKMHDRVQEGITVSYLSRRNPFKPVHNDASLLDVCKTLAAGAHRVPVVEDGKVINIISQSTIAKFLHDHCKNEPLWAKKLNEVNIGSSPVLTVHETDSALMAFSKMDDNRRAGIGVIDRTGRLIANTSASDLKLYLQYHESLHQPIMEFLNKIRQMSLYERAPVFTCTGNDTLAHLVGKLCATKAHRIFLVNEDIHPVKVVAVSDIIKTILKS